MTVYHLVLLGLAAIGALACAKDAPILPRCCALLGWVAMAVAMLGGFAGLIIGSAVMILVALPMVRRELPLWLNMHRVLTMLCMTSVLVALYAINGDGFCGPGAIPLLTAGGIVPLPMVFGTYFLVHTSVALLVILTCLSLCALALSARKQSRMSVTEIVPTSLAVIGMAVGTG